MNDQAASMSSPKRQKLPVRGKGIGVMDHQSASRSQPLDQLEEAKSAIKSTTEVIEIESDLDLDLDWDLEDHIEDTRQNTATGQHVSPKTSATAPLEMPTRNPLAMSTRSDLNEHDQEDAREEEESSDGDAPEVVSTSRAAAQSLKDAKAAAKAVEQKAAEEKQRRRERDAFFRKQTEERRKAATKIAEEKQQPALDAQDVMDLGNDSSAGHHTEMANASGVNTVEEMGSSKKRRMSEVPALLPRELLESDDEEAPARQPSGDRPEEKSRKTKLDVSSIDKRLARERWPSRPHDIVRDGRVYKVMKPRGGERLLPRMDKHSRNMKMKLLVRNRAVYRSGGGFFANK